VIRNCLPRVAPLDLAHSACLATPLCMWYSRPESIPCELHGSYGTGSVCTVQLKYSADPMPNVLHRRTAGLASNPPLCTPLRFSEVAKRSDLSFIRMAGKKFTAIQFTVTIPPFPTLQRGAAAVYQNGWQKVHCYTMVTTPPFTLRVKGQLITREFT